MSPDKIHIEGMEFFGHHGVYLEERTEGRRFAVDVEIERDLQPAGRSDNLADTIDYSTVYRLAKKVVEGPGHNLIEALAESIAAEILNNTTASAVKVRVSKPGLSIDGGKLDRVSVSIHRSRTPSAG